MYLNDTVESEASWFCYSLNGYLQESILMAVIKVAFDITVNYYEYPNHTTPTATYHVA